MVNNVLALVQTVILAGFLWVYVIFVIVNVLYVILLQINVRDAAKVIIYRALIVSPWLIFLLDFMDMKERLSNVLQYAPHVTEDKRQIVKAVSNNPLNII